VQRDEEEEEGPNVEEMIEFLEGLNEPLESEPLRDCVEDLRELGGLTENLQGSVEAIDDMLNELVEEIEEEIDADKGGDSS